MKAISIGFVIEECDVDYDAAPHPKVDRIGRKWESAIYLTADDSFARNWLIDRMVDQVLRTFDESDMHGFLAGPRDRR